ncbi:MAG: hypothetical protein DIZ80_16815 [endosymbiont of Galathealinum brachiosum]|uniref:Uncharacterized protein n=1 Tax=endosymbiont of Galathealinum brachiosum TaxID=2200906 RepID=A0A370D6P1_9GAMM|nr:MAG: hypothetical protein DIZ80_16815 [endosymbiont of Galathealinum brachiosum]
MNPFTKHTKQQGVSYLLHLGFATGIAWRLLSSVIAFALHAVFPFIDIDKSLDLDATIDYLQERNHWIESRPLNRVETESNTAGHWFKKGVWFVLFS